MSEKIENEVKAELIDAARIAEQLPGENEFWDGVEAIWNAGQTESGLVEKRKTNAN